MTYNSGGSSTITAPVRGIELSGERDTKKGNFIPPHMVAAVLGFFTWQFLHLEDHPIRTNPGYKLLCFVLKFFELLCYFVNYHFCWVSLCSVGLQLTLVLKTTLGCHVERTQKEHYSS